MIETICNNCGNKKSFEDSFMGRTFKCPNCSNPVKIEHLSNQIVTEPTSVTNSLADEIARAEKEKKIKNEAELWQAILQANKKKSKNFILYGIILAIYGVSCFGTYSESHEMSYIFMGLGSIGGAIYFFRKRHKLLKRN
ncbi:MAG: LPXTG cell wall anchor domain-containing protein [Saprospiraceae bacterium]|uniref:LPXTG cell wall anchor domain-containing protein n=1 Tax=Candidatus Defluviibacterium haderslevense TaxID=2981993 RepID=A0A9D7SBA5_9BACT|nr:LPXTG cell wall anchor domain-containing protein [Candidatus Defluviibacterium haderslevense]MBL0235776.1 LPXTG cell wall anchor domain-containing protein [Candidatus Defluviibacterium haderslevense]